MREFEYSSVLLFNSMRTPADSVVFPKRPNICPISQNHAGLGMSRGLQFVASSQLVAVVLCCVDRCCGSWWIRGVFCLLRVLHGESSKRLAPPRNTKDRKHLQSTLLHVSRDLHGPL